MADRKFDLHFLVHSIARSLQRKGGVPADRYWEPLNQIAWELSCLLRESGFIQALPRDITSIAVMMCFDEAYGFDPAESHLEGKKQFKVYVHLDASDYSSLPADEGRYWPQWAVCLDALCDAALRLTASPDVIERLLVARSNLPIAAPWPPLPPFDMADVERQYMKAASATVVADSSGRIRVVKQLDARKDVLWIMCGPLEGDALIDRLQGDLRELVADRKLGEWDGDSRNGLVSDISFQVKNLARAAVAVQNFLEEHWPSLDFAIGDEYDPDVFEKLR